MCESSILSPLSQQPKPSRTARTCRQTESEPLPELMTQSNGDNEAPQQSDTAVRVRAPRQSSVAAAPISDSTLDDTSPARRRLPAYSFVSRVSVESARIDKLTAKITVGQLTTSDSGDIAYLRRNLCLQPPSRFFHHVPHHGERDFAGLPVRNSVIGVDGVLVGKPLFTGKLFLRPLVHGQTHGGYTVSFEGTLNPTRAVRYRGSEYLANFENLQALCESGFFEPIGHSDSLPSCLDGNDNIVSGEMSDSSYNHAELVHLRFLPYAISDEIRRRNSEDSDATLSLNSSRHVLDKCEIYWDFRRRDARAFLEELTPSLKLFAKKWRKRNHPNETHSVDEGVEREAFTIRLFLSESVDIQIYAKCRDRIRFEVCFRKPERHIGRKTFDSFEDFHEKLFALRGNAAALINELFEFLEENSVEPLQNLAQSSEFVRSWVNLFGWDDPESWQLLTDLQRHGVVRNSSKMGEARKNAIRSAKRHGLLSYDARTKEPIRIEVHSLRFLVYISNALNSHQGFGSAHNS